MLLGESLDKLEEKCKIMRIGPNSAYLFVLDVMTKSNYPN